MNEKLKHKIRFVLVDTGYWIITLLAIVISLTVLSSFVVWVDIGFRVLWSLKWLVLRVIVVLSLLLALLGGWSSNYRG